MDIVQKILIYLTFIICLGCLALLSVSLATEEWLKSKPIIERDVINRTNVRKFEGEVHFGLFSGKKNLNFGFGDRLSNIIIKCFPSKNACSFVEKSNRNQFSRSSSDLKFENLNNTDIKGNNNTVKTILKEDPPMIIYGLWLFTVLSVALSMLFGLVGAIFAVINSVTTPVELITGILGLYLWNGMGALFSLGAVISWILQFYLKLNKNVMTKEELKLKWNSDGRSSFGYSFILVIVALCLYVINIIIVTIIIKQPWKIKVPKTKIQKNPEGVIMLY
ncbi:clarin-3-like isoform X2 [Centruroides sculpturatus]|uniref:clarin-3-like isoform X1 n=1 Tax=Centruroides sculpturatus TaxID=218467 RepID=UPI000C6CAEFB|nr:clarin-3-like isoform X1 [Centruroides sculpturatus]XP_023239743.1 clarin-3-like isoform X2 [Centruroides sculpturatus]